MNPNLTGTIQLTEILWTVAALPGVWLWAQNMRNARASRRAIRQLAVGNGRAVFAKYAVKATTSWLGIELLFLMIGAVAMTAPPSVTSTTARSLVIAAGLILASAGISYLALQWHRVDEALLKMARDRYADRNVLDLKQDVREAEQNDRETGQNTRETEQNDRDFRQDSKE